MFLHSSDGRKSKSKSSSTTEHRHASTKAGTSASSKQGRSDDADADQPHQATAVSTARSSGHIMTASERKFEEARRKRQQDKIRKEAKTSHKEKVDAFNKYLGSLSEHHDIPKVGPG